MSASPAATTETAEICESLVQLEISPSIETLTPNKGPTGTTTLETAPAPPTTQTAKWDLTEEQRVVVERNLLLLSKETARLVEVKKTTDATILGMLYEYRNVIQFGTAQMHRTLVERLRDFREEYGNLVHQYGIHGASDALIEFGEETNHLIGDFKNRFASITNTVESRIIAVLNENIAQFKDLQKKVDELQDYLLSLKEAALKTDLETSKLENVGKMERKIEEKKDDASVGLDIKGNGGCSSVLVAVNVDGASASGDVDGNEDQEEE